MTTATEASTKSVLETLNKQIANWGVLYVKLHNYHWFVKGKNFFTLHEKFQELYEEAAAHLDELAERVLSIKGKPIATMKEMLAEATIKEAAGDESADQMIRAVINDFQAMISEMRRGIDQADEAGDHTTADLLTGIQNSLEKQVWMLEATLG